MALTPDQEKLKEAALALQSLPRPSYTGEEMTFSELANPAAILAILAQLEQVQGDADRYRWLRMQDWFDGPLCVLAEPKRVLTNGSGLGADCPSRERLDAAIDAAKAVKPLPPPPEAA